MKYHVTTLLYQQTDMCGKTNRQMRTNRQTIAVIIYRLQCYLRGDIPHSHLLLGSNILLASIWSFIWSSLEMWFRCMYHGVYWAGSDFLICRNYKVRLSCVDIRSDELKSNFAPIVRKIVIRSNLRRYSSFFLIIFLLCSFFLVIFLHCFLKKPLVEQPSHIIGSCISWKYKI